MFLKIARLRTEPETGPSGTLAIRISADEIFFVKEKNAMRFVNQDMTYFVEEAFFR